MGTFFFFFVVLEEGGLVLLSGLEGVGRGVLFLGDFEDFFFIKRLFLEMILLLSFFGKFEGDRMVILGIEYWILFRLGCRMRLFVCKLKSICLYRVGGIRKGYGLVGRF